MTKMIKGILLVCCALIVLALIVFLVIYAGRLRTISSLQKLTDYDDYNLYRMDVKYDYDLDAVIDSGITDNQSMLNAIIGEALPLLPIRMEAPDFGCSAFTATDTDGHILMGRNYDFKLDTSALLVYCTPKNGYKSVAFAALDNVSANVPDESIKTKLSCLAAPFICLDGMNEKGVSIAVLTLDSKPTHQDTGKPVIATPLVIRLVLDRAATTQEAVDLLQQYDMFASSGRDYHFYITDAGGDGRIVEYDCDSPDRTMTVTPVRTVTNFYEMYRDKVEPDQHNGIYGHGKERWDRIEAVLDAGEGSLTRADAWKALQAASQLPSPEDVTSNTQWSIVYDDTALTAQFVLRRNWDSSTFYSLKENTASAGESTAQ